MEEKTNPGIQQVDQTSTAGVERLLESAERSSFWDEQGVSCVCRLKRELSKWLGICF